MFDFFLEPWYILISVVALAVGFVVGKLWFDIKGIRVGIEVDVHEVAGWSERYPVVRLECRNRRAVERDMFYGFFGELFSLVTGCSFIRWYEELNSRGNWTYWTQNSIHGRRHRQWRHNQPSPEPSHHTSAYR